MKLYLIAGEASGDLLGAGLMRALKARVPGVQFHGIGGEKMQAEGLTSLFPYHELSLMGFAEVIPHLFKLTARIGLAVEDVLARAPDAVITIDSPGFTFRVARKLREAGYAGKLIHYVAPSVWAYKPERAEKCAALFDAMLCLLPFEPPYFEAEGLRAPFVGHPVAELPLGDGAAFRTKYDISADVPLLTLLPGSRENEIRRHMPVFGAAVAELAVAHPNLALAVPVSARLLPLLGLYFKDCPFRAVVVTGEEDKRGALAASQAALVKSGTISLEVARSGLAQVVAYRANPISVWLVRRMIKIPYVNLINIMAQREVIPELLQERCTPHALAQALLPLMADAQARAEQVTAAAEQLARLKAGMPASEAAAQEIMRFF